MERYHPYEPVVLHQFREFSKILMHRISEEFHSAGVYQPFANLAWLGCAGHDRSAAASKNAFRNVLRAAAAKLRVAQEQYICRILVPEILLFCAVPLSLKQRKQLRHSTLKNCGCHYRTRSLQSVIFIYSLVQIYLYTFYQTMCKIRYPLYVIFL